MHARALFAALTILLLCGCGDDEATVPSGQLRSTTDRVGVSAMHVDLLFVVDDSSSAFDERPLFARAAGELVRELTSPTCSTGLEEWPGDPNRTCVEGSAPNPVVSLRVGLITSSPGSALGSSCKPASGQLLAELEWDPGREDAPPTFVSIQGFANEVRDAILAIDSTGCGFEAPLEAWYRFLFDSDAPPDVRDSRERFRRPDARVMIAMLSDENDCSLKTGPEAELLTSDTPLPPPTAACSWDPWHPCCRSCGAKETEPPAGCAPLAADLGCTGDVVDDDPFALRCWEPKRRFGLDVLQPLARYTEALHSGPRHATLTGVVGLPWQDIGHSIRWDLALGGDPFQRESWLPRGGMHPLTGDQPTLPNPINGIDGERAEQLQRACIFPLAEPRLCEAGHARCDCDGPFDPACPDGRQHFGTSFPSLRQLETMMETSGVPGSACAQDHTQGYADFSRRASRDLLNVAHGGKCVEKLAVDNDRRARCRLFEVTQTAACTCDGEARKPVSEESIRALVLTETREETGCVCELDQLDGSALEVCRDDPARYPVDPDSGGLVDGWCYVEPATGLGRDEVLDEHAPWCDQFVRVLAGALPRASAEHVFACVDPD